MVKFEEDKHLHVGFYDDGFDLEGLFLKKKSIEKWCLFFHNEFYNIPPKKVYELFDKEFGYMVREYEINESDFTFDKANELFKEFLLEEDIIK